MEKAFPLGEILIATKRGRKNINEVYKHDTRQNYNIAKDSGVNNLRTISKAIFSFKLKRCIPDNLN